ncbi:MAG TPA: NAD-dependent epimerase/dehydratase family protein [Candidatus Solibacter sp.]|nr:NAD-dependent epimerase/dehydratase family protein [Candidatus Solibacter sp.]
MRRVLVTGATGQIGAHLCKRLQTELVEVHAVSRDAQVDHGDEIRWWRADLRNADATRSLLAAIQPEVVFHLAARVTGGRGPEAVLPTLEHNLHATVSLLIALTEVGCGRIVLAGSLEEPPDGSTEVCSSPYAVSKWSARAYARMFHALYKTPVVNTRIFMVYGPGKQPNARFVPHVISSLLSGEVPKLTSGRRKVDWIYIDDVIEGLLACARSEDVLGDTVDLGSGRLTELRAVALLIAELIGTAVCPDFGAIADRPMEQVRVANVQRTYDRLGWRPKTSLETGLRNTIAWFQTRTQQ